MEGSASVGPAAVRRTPWQVSAGWLLRTHRLCSARTSLRPLPGFARAFHDGYRGAAGRSHSSLSRWETGRVPVTQEAVRRYEDVLGLPAYALLAPIQTIARHEGGATAAAFLRGEPGPPTARPPGGRLEALLDRALDGGVLTGDDWDTLSRAAVHGPERVMPGRVRSAVARRLLEETLVSDGTAWMRRFEALGRLLADPGWGPEAAAVCSGVGEQPGHVGLIEAVCALDGSPHPDAGRAVLRQLTDPTNQDSGYGALLACARKTRRRHFDTRQTRTLVEVADALLTSRPGPGAKPAVAEAAAVLLHQLPLTRTHFARLLDTVGRRNDTAQAIVLHGSLADPAAASVGIGRILSRLTAEVPAQTAPVFSGILDDLLHHPVADVRLYTAMLVRASPFGPAVADACAAELRRPATARVEHRAIPLLHALRVLGGPEQRDTVAHLTLARGVPPGVALAAVHALSHIGGRSPEGYWRALFAHHTATTATPAGPVTTVTTAADEADRQAVVRRLVYCFAMAGQLPLLTLLVEQERDRAAPARHLSLWWVGLAHHISASARL
ncbi:helix-turn-helix transcriptional regulator [Streptomyces sp. NPDC096080]|uniref:helix-turn-helix transcriptional regulator n=1 Tax=Streptomyces sp. NPDC096080 TaxID=3156693 RepID=UPI00331BB65F